MKSLSSTCLAMLVAFGVGCGPASNPPAGPAATPARSQPVSTTPHPGEPGTPWFEPIDASSGLDFRHSTGKTGRYYLPEMETGGVGLIDFDRDGLMDVVCIDGGSLEPGKPVAPRHRLYRNLGGWKFADVTASSGFACPDGYGMGCAVGDYDGDGWPDLYVTQLGSNHLFRNNGNGTFTDVTAKAGVAVHSMSTSAAFVDYDGDGRLDLMVVNYVRWTPAAEIECYSSGGRRDYCSPLNYHAPAPTVLFHNRGDGTFADVTEAAGLSRVYGNGFGIATGDFDHDGRTDLYVANDAMPNQLWLNQGNGRFVEDAALRGCALNALGVPRAGMGVVAVDLLQRGWLDLFVTHLAGEGNGLFLNQNGNFIDSVTPDGPMAGSLPYTGFGLGFADFDNDGELDLYVSNGRVRLGTDQPDPTDPYSEPSTLRRGLGGGRFAEVPRAGLAVPQLGAGRGMAVGDLDNDGSVDVVVVNRDGPLRVLRNRVGRGNHWLELRLVDAAGREARNAIVRVESGGKIQWRQNQPNQGDCSSHDPRVHFGLGPATVAGHAWVRWANGTAEEFGPLAADQILELRAGRGRPALGVFSW
jgi:hypothetical protein